MFWSLNFRCLSQTQVAEGNVKMTTDSEWIESGVAQRLPFWIMSFKRLSFVGPGREQV